MIKVQVHHVLATQLGCRALPECLAVTRAEAISDSLLASALAFKLPCVITPETLWDNEKMDRRY